MPRQYSTEFRQRALRLLETTMEASDVSEFEAIKSVASKLGISEESLRRWRRKAQVDAGERPGTTSQEHAEIRRLKREITELRRANEVLKAASAFFCSGARPPRDEMIAFIDTYRDQFGVELICRGPAVPAQIQGVGDTTLGRQKPSQPVVPSAVFGDAVGDLYGGPRTDPAGRLPLADEYRGLVDLRWKRERAGRRGIVMVVTR
jgi:transposase